MLEEMCIGRWKRIVRAYVSEFGYAEKRNKSGYGRD